MAFETKMRDVIRGCIEPIIAMSVEDREVMFAISRKDNDIVKRLELLEAAVFKKNKTIGRTIFDDYEEKF